MLFLCRCLKDKTTNGTCNLTMAASNPLTLAVVYQGSGPPPITMFLKPPRVSTRLHPKKDLDQFSRFRRAQVRYRQTHHATGSSIATVRISCIRRELITHWRNLYADLRASDNQANQSAVVSAGAFHAVVQALSEVRVRILRVLYCSCISIQQRYTILITGQAVAK